MYCRNGADDNPAKGARGGSDEEYNMLSLRQKLQLASTLIVCLTSIGRVGAATTSSHAKATRPASTMTFQHLKNGSYQIPDLACGYRQVKLSNGNYKDKHCQVVFGNATFGDLNGDNLTDAVVHVAFRDGNSPWMQQLLFVVNDRNRLLQVGDYSIDENAELKSLRIKNKEVTSETRRSDVGSHKTLDKVTKIRMFPAGGKAIALHASEWRVDPNTRELKPYEDMAPYLYTVEDRVKEFWAPTARDKAESVGVTFKINKSGSVVDLKLEHSSEIEEADSAALKAVLAAAPFAPLPADNEELQVSLEFNCGVYCNPTSQ